MKDRIRQIQNKTQMSQQDFAKAIGVAPGSLSSVYSGRTEPSTNFIKGIHAAFPEVDTNWLVFGEGEMNSPTPQESQTPPPSSSVEGGAAVPTTPEVISHAGDLFAPEKSTKNFDIKQREVMEIRVFFSDGTYESYLPAKWPSAVVEPFFGPASRSVEKISNFAAEYLKTLYIN